MLCLIHNTCMWSNTLIYMSFNAIETLIGQFTLYK